MKTALIFGGLALAFAADRPNLNGSWQSSAAGETLEIQQTDDTIHIKETGHDKPVEYNCTTTGKSCKMKDGEISLWYNGGMLVMMEQSHGNSRVVKRRWTVAPDGKTLNEEVIHISPAGNTEKIAYSRTNGS